MNAQNFFLAFVASLALSACKSAQPIYLAQPMAVNAQGSYHHLASGMTFPPAVGDFERVKITQYDAAGEDVGVGYNLVSPIAGIAATVYVYPAPSLLSIGSPPDVVASARGTLCNNEFARRKKELVDAHSGARLIQERAAPPPGGGPQIPARWQHSNMMTCSAVSGSHSIRNCTFFATLAGNGL